MEHIHWLGHATVRLDFDKVIYLDPWKLRSGAPQADIILITHDHYDHFSKPDIDKIRKDSTALVTIASVAADALYGYGVGIQAVPAYNIGKQFHPKSAGHVGFVIQTGGHTIYIAGDSDLTPEMKSVRAEIVLLPVGGKYTMTAEEAAQAANAIQPKLAIPLHYGDIVGSKADAERFRSLCKVPVQILQHE
jgi:L-ascorbate metabolism protein UlaG (beta-lactamase superfamily)